MPPHVLVVTSCTAQKASNPPNALTWTDFQSSDRTRRAEALRPFWLPAGQMYTGGQHVDLMTGVHRFRSTGGRIDIAILSAGYGVLAEETVIAPYHVTFAALPALVRRPWIQQLAIAETLQTLVQSYDLVFFLLGGLYLEAAGFSWPRDRGPLRIFLAGRSQAAQIGTGSRCYALGVGIPEARVFHRGLVRLKGFLFTQFLAALYNRYDGSWTAVLQDPTIIRAAMLTVCQIPEDSACLPWIVRP